MNTLKERVRWSPNFIRAFGLAGGLRLLRGIVQTLPRESTTVQGHQVPGYTHPIYLRRSVSDHATFRQCMVMQQYDFSDLPQSGRMAETYQSLLQQGQRPLIIDAGANIGLATLWFARVFPEATIVAVEPDERNFALLEQNTRHLKDRVVLLKGGVWSHPAHLGIINPDAGAAGYQVGEVPADHPNAVRAYTMEEICHQAGVSEPLIVKLDIEGAQAQVFKEGTDWVARAHLITLELDDWQLPWKGTSRSFFRCVSQHPFDYLIHKESIFCFRDDSANPPSNANASAAAGRPAGAGTAAPGSAAQC